MKAVLNIIIVINVFILLFSCDNPYTEGEYINIIYDFSNAFEEWDESVATINSIRTGGDEVPHIDPTHSMEGDYSVILGIEVGSGESYFSANVTFLQDCVLSFRYKKNDNYGDLYFRVDGATKLNADWTSLDWTKATYMVPAGNHKIEWKQVSSSSKEEQIWIDCIKVAPSPDFSNAFEEWDETIGNVDSITRSGNKVPYIDSTESTAGSYSVIFGEYEPNGNSIFQADVTLNYDSIISFDHKRSRFGGSLYFRLNGTALLNDTGSESDWRSVSCMVAAGTNTLQWEHDKGYYHQDWVWIDNITAAPLPEFSNALEEWDNTAGSINSISRSGTEVPYIDSSQMADGLYSVIFDESKSNTDSSFTANVTLLQDSVIRFKYKKNAPSGYLYFRADGVELLNTIDEAIAWTGVSHLLTTGTHILEWELNRYYNSYGQTWIDGISAYPAPDFSTAFEEWDSENGTISSITRRGDNVPYIDVTQDSVGSYSVIFGEYRSTGNSIFQADVNIDQDSIISFKYKRSESGADLYFRIDDTVQLKTSAAAEDWIEVSYPITSGAHTLEWEHDKYYDGLERAWIDDIRVTPAPAP